MMLQRKFAIAALAIGAAIFGAIAGAGFWGGLRLNLTPSFPRGIWRIEHLGREAAVGDRVFICPPNTPAFVLGLERNYLLKGLCPGGMGPLIKTIVAVAGQVIDIETAVIIDGHALPNSVVRAADFADRRLPRFGGGPVPPGFVFLHSDFGGSYDSRYFGPLPASGILGLAVPVLVFTQ